MLSEERKKYILDLLEEKKFVTITELCSHFNVSRPTIRNDLSSLSSEGFLTQLRGGAQSISNITIDKPLPEREIFMSDTKKIIAKRVVDDLPSGKVIFIDSSTTVLAVCHELIKCHNKALTVVTCFLDAALILSQAPFITTILYGGILQEDRFLFDENTIKNLSSTNIDIALFGCLGLSPHGKFLYESTMSLHIKETVSSVAGQSWICADHTKFDTNQYFKNIVLPDSFRLYTD